jgi:hypothetical protein
MSAKREIDLRDRNSYETPRIEDFGRLRDDEFDAVRHGRVIAAKQDEKTPTGARG